MGVSCSSINSGDTFLWKVDDGNSHIYLLGSIHIGQPDMYPLDDRIEAAYDDSKEVAFEVDMSKVNPMDLLKYMTYTDGTVLKDKISEESYNKLKAIFEKAGMPEASYQTMKPWAAAVTAQQLILVDGGYDLGLGIDQHFLQKAQTDSKNVRQLETAEFQMSLFTEFDKVGDSFIDYTLSDTEKSKDEVSAMVSAWQSGDKATLNKYINGERDKYPEFEKAFEKIIDQRNNKMTDKIVEWLGEDKTIFIVVGAGHLIGENGIINQLSKKGKYTIKNF
jgi:uncharacterized protein YbaP (TraB family)